MDKAKMVAYSDRILELGVYCLIAFTAFSISLVEIVSTIMIVLWIIRMFLTREFRRLNVLPVKLLGLYFLWGILSCFNSGYASESFRGVMKIVEYGMIFIIGATMSWKNDMIRRLPKVFAGVVATICLNGFYQYFSGKDLIRGRELIKDDYLHRISSSFVHPNDFGVWLFVGILVLMAMVFVKREAIMNRVLYGGAFLASLVGLYLTKSRGAWLSFAAAVIAFGAIRSRKALAGIILLLALSVAVMPNVGKERLAGLFDMSSGTTAERLQLWEGAVNMIKVHPVLGFGVNTYSRHFPDYRPKDYPDARYSHNCYLQMASEIGIPGAFIFIAFIFSVIIGAVFRINGISDEKRKALVAGLAAGLAGFAVNSAVDTHMYSLTLAVFFNLMMGICYSLALSGGENRKRKVQ